MVNCNWKKFFSFLSYLFLYLICFQLSCSSSIKNIFIYKSEPMVRVKILKGKHRNKILEVPMETYLAGVIGSEMHASWPVQALKAQAVAARSYALVQMMKARKRGRDYDLVNTQADQVFKASLTRNTRLKKIVDQTRGQVLWKNGYVVRAYYSSTCGGRTETAKGAQLSRTSPLQSTKRDKYCKISPFRNWKETLTGKEIAERLKKRGVKTDFVYALKVKDRNPSGYAHVLEYRDERGKHEINAKTFRSMIGWRTIKSLYFNVKEKRNNVFVFQGHGFGHGVGLCQYGAKGMADRHKNYKKILKNYYSGTDIVRIYR